MPLHPAPHLPAPIPTARTNRVVQVEGDCAQARALTPSLIALINSGAGRLSLYPSCGLPAPPRALCLWTTTRTAAGPAASTAGLIHPSIHPSTIHPIHVPNSKQKRPNKAHRVAD